MTNRTRKTAATTDPPPSVPAPAPAPAPPPPPPTPAAEPEKEKDPFLIGCIRFNPKWVHKPWSNNSFRWLVLVSCAVWYNLILIAPRTVFHELQEPPRVMAFVIFDYTCDLLFIMDMFIKATTGYLENGILIKEPRKLFQRYVKSKDFLLDIVSVFPTDLLWLITGWISPFPIFRINRLFKLPRVGEFYYRAQTRLDSPNTFRLIYLILTMIVVVHLNACVYFGVSSLIGIGTNRWVYPGRAGWRLEEAHGEVHASNQDSTSDRGANDVHEILNSSELAHGFPVSTHDLSHTDIASVHDAPNSPISNTTLEKHTTLSVHKREISLNESFFTDFSTKSDIVENTSKKFFTDSATESNITTDTLKTFFANSSIESDIGEYTSTASLIYVETTSDAMLQGYQNTTDHSEQSEISPNDAIAKPLLVELRNDDSYTTTAECSNDCQQNSTSSVLDNGDRNYGYQLVEASTAATEQDNNPVNHTVQRTSEQRSADLQRDSSGRVDGDSEVPDQLSTHLAYQIDRHQSDFNMQSAENESKTSDYAANGKLVSLRVHGSERVERHVEGDSKNADQFSANSTLGHRTDSHQGDFNGLSVNNQSEIPNHEKPINGDNGVVESERIGRYETNGTDDRGASGHLGGHESDSLQGENSHKESNGTSEHDNSGHSRDKPQAESGHGGGEVGHEAEAGHEVEKEKEKPFRYSSEFVNDTLLKKYSYSIYWSVKMMTSKPFELCNPTSDIEFLFHIADAFLGIFMFASIVGEVDGIIESINKQSDDFKSHLDSVKQYISMRKVGKEMESRVVKWFDYIWANNGQLDEESVLTVLPEPLRIEIARHVHLDVLKKVPLFQGVDEQFLVELAEKLKFEAFCPGDYVCRKGDIGREIYVLRRGLLNVIAADGVKVIVTLKSGVVFGELSVLNMPGSLNGNRRTVTVRSVGYADLFSLSKENFWSCLEEYPEVKEQLMEKARAILKRDNLINEDAAKEAARRGRNFKEVADRMESGLENVNIRMERFWQEQININTKFILNIEELEKMVKKAPRVRPKLVPYSNSMPPPIVMVTLDTSEAATGDEDKPITSRT